MKNRLLRKEVAAVVVVGIALSGCASPAMNENMIIQGEQLYLVTPGSKFHQGIKKITVAGGSETIPFLSSQVSSEDFQIALNTSLKNAGVLSDNGKYDLKVKLIAIDQPSFGLGMTVRSTVDYLISDKTNGSTIFDETIESSFTAGMSDSMIGIKRLRLANEGSIRRNIELFIKKISKAK